MNKRGDTDIVLRVFIAAIFVGALLFAQIAFAQRVADRVDFWKKYHIKNTGTLLMMALGSNGNLEFSYDVSMRNEFIFSIDKNKGTWAVLEYMKDPKKTDTKPARFYFGTDHNIDIKEPYSFEMPEMLTFYKSGRVFGINDKPVDEAACSYNKVKSSFIRKSVLLKTDTPEISDQLEQIKIYLAAKPKFNDETLKNTIISAGKADITVMIRIDQDAENSIAFSSKEKVEENRYLACLFRTKLNSITGDLPAIPLNNMAAYLGYENNIGVAVFLKDKNLLLEPESKTKIAEAIYDSLVAMHE